MFVGTSVGSYPADIRRKVTDFETRAAFEGVAALSACDEELEMTAGVGNVFSLPPSPENGCGRVRAVGGGGREVQPRVGGWRSWHPPGIYIGIYAGGG